MALDGPAPRAAAGQPSASARILDAVARRIVIAGVAAVSMQDVAH